MDLPEGFLKEISKYPELDILKDSLLSEPEVSVRFNPCKTVPADYADSPRVPWCGEGVYLFERPRFTFDPAFHQGRYYVQDASSMAIAAVLRHLVDSPVRYLDACAAPGGKVTSALSVLPEGSVTLANEYDFKRADILVENIAKWGNPNVVVSRGDTSRFRKLTSMFDIVSVDAPCSGEGMMRKDMHAREQWSEALVKQCASIQREILGNLWCALRPGGYLIYSTCTFNRTENEENVEWLIDEYDAQPIVIDGLEAIPTIHGGIGCSFPCYRFIPGNVKGEGLFIAVLRKGEDPTAKRPKIQSSIKSLNDKRINKWLRGQMEFIRIDDDVYALPGSNASLMQFLVEKLDVVYVGVHVATIKGKDIIPAHELALSSIIDISSFEVCDMNIEDSIRFLQRDNLVLSDEVKKGYVLLTYNNYPLGFVKNLGPRVNSLLPKQWCIKNRITDLTSLNTLIQPC